MTEAFRAIQISPRVYWVGAIDWGIRNFHGYLTGRGTTYNAFLVMGKEVTLIDTVKAPFFDEMMSRISSVVDPKKIQHIISCHSELDHSGCMDRLAHRINPQGIIASLMGQKALKNHLHWDREVRPVKDKERLDLGGNTFSFFETRMLHWPDSMFAYLHEDRVLFTNDAFGMHLASVERFSDPLPREVIDYEAAKYFANILLPFAPMVKKQIDRLPTLGIDPQIIAPDHGPIHRKDPMKIVNDYSRWADQQASAKAVVVYDSMWESTAKMARAMGEGLGQCGVQVRLMPLAGSHRSDVATEILEAGALLVGAPTMNNQLYPTMADLMTYIKGLKPKNLIGAAFGSYGWSGEAVMQLQKYLEETKIEIVAEGLKIKYIPDQAQMKSCHELGQSVGKQLKERLQ
jgi:flavorubredoxin